MTKAKKLTHVDAKGRIRMVDVGDKAVTDREAVARGSIVMSKDARKLIQSGNNKKGDPIQAARGRHHGREEDQRADSAVSSAEPLACVG
jgi:hypothetical protein